MRGLFIPNDGNKIPILQLDGSKKDVRLSWV